jgi:hypothetical protein
LAGVAAVEAVPRPATEAGTALATGRSPRQDDKVAYGNVVYAVSDLFDNPGCFVSKQEGKVVRDRSLPVVQIGMTDAGCLHAYDHLALSGVWHDYRLEPYCLTFASCDYAPNFTRHVCSFVMPDLLPVFV